MEYRLECILVCFSVGPLTQMEGSFIWGVLPLATIALFGFVFSRSVKALMYTFLFCWACFSLKMLSLYPMDLKLLA